jgi:hypothetical protein
MVVARKIAPGVLAESLHRPSSDGSIECGLRLPGRAIETG